MRIEDLQLPEGHVIVSLGDVRRGDGRVYAGEFMAVVEGDGFVPLPSVVLNPECFRLVPVALVGEYRAMLERHEQDHVAFAERVRTMPEIHVHVSIR